MGLARRGLSETAVIAHGNNAGATTIRMRSVFKFASGVKLALRVASGITLLIVGALLSLPGVPGPGIPLILVGLWILSDHFTWARRAHGWVAEKWRRVRQAASTGPQRPAETAPGVPEEK